jgi:hypothetical protein
VPEKPYHAKKGICSAKNVFIPISVSATGPGLYFLLKCPVTQKKDIKRQKEKLDAWKREIDEEKIKAREVARERVLADFEKTHLGLAARPTEIETKSGTSTEHGEIFRILRERLI